MITSQLDNLLKEEEFAEFIKYVKSNEKTNYLTMSYEEYRGIIFSLMKEGIPKFKQNFNKVLTIYLKQLRMFELQNVIESDLQLLKKEEIQKELSFLNKKYAIISYCEQKKQQTKTSLTSANMGLSLS